MRVGSKLSKGFEKHDHLKPMLSLNNVFNYEEFEKFEERIIKRINNEDITIFGNGEQTRAYCYIDDAINMIKNICLEGKHFVYNVGKMDEEISAKILAEKVLKTVPNSKSKLTTSI